MWAIALRKVHLLKQEIILDQRSRFVLRNWYYLMNFKEYHAELCSIYGNTRYYSFAIYISPV